MPSATTLAGRASASVMPAAWRTCWPSYGKTKAQTRIQQNGSLSASAAAFGHAGHVQQQLRIELLPAVDSGLWGCGAGELIHDGGEKGRGQFRGQGDAAQAAQDALTINAVYLDHHPRVVGMIDIR